MKRNGRLRFTELDTKVYKWYCIRKIAGELERVEKVKPDPLNLSVNTGVGKQFFIRIIIHDKQALSPPGEGVFFAQNGAKAEINAA